MMKSKKLIRVTTVLDWCDSKWKEYWFRKVGFEAADKISKESAEFGTEVHKIVEDCLITLSNGDVPVQNNQEMCAREILAYLNYGSDIKPLFKSYSDSLEIEVKDENLGLVGHFDYAALIDGVPTIIDFKTSNKMRKSFPLQKAAYAKMANKQYEININQGLTIRSHWNKETQQVDFEVKKYDDLIGTYWPVFKSCLEVYKYFNGKE